MFVLGAGYISEIRWERSGGVVFKTDDSFTPSAVSVPLLFSCTYLMPARQVKNRWGEITDFTNPGQ